MLRANPDTIALATTPDEVEAQSAEGKLVALIGIENSYPLGTTPEEVAEAVAMWAERGARYASITHFGHNQFGGSSNPSESDGEDPGLSDLGRALIAALNDHGIMVDVSHVGPRTAAEAMQASRAPVIASHSTAQAVYDNPRGLTDEQLLAIRDGGGVAQITAYRSYLADVDPQTKAAMSVLGARLGLNSGADFAAASPETLIEYVRERDRIRTMFGDITLDQFLDHVDHAVEVAGIDHVGLSGDFDGGGGVAGWDNAADSPNVTAALLERGYSEQDLAKIWGGNLLRVMRDVQAAATE
jgi:membrane dipeptidase